VLRTVLVAHPSDHIRERVSEVVRALGYRVLEARTPVEAGSALDACPISCMIVDDGLLCRCDLPWVLVRVPVIVLSDGERGVAHQFGVVAKSASLDELPGALATLIGHPRYRGPRDVVRFPNAIQGGVKRPTGSA
jgi:hypothetical protein